MAETRDEFEEAWARIVEDLTSDPDGDPASDLGDHVDTGAPAETEVPTDSAAPAETQGSTDPGSPAEPPTGAARVDPGLAALFEPLRREQPAPDRFVDNWDDEGHFVPPEPPEIPEGTPVKRLAWAGTLGGPAVLILGALSGWDAPGVVNLGAGLAFLAGFATLVWQMPESREDGWDDGARL